MDQNVKDLAEHLLRAGFEDLPERERRVISQIAKRVHISQNINRAFDEKLALGQRLADRVSAFGGSWTFIILFGVVLVVWVLLNSFVLAQSQDAFDPYPYVFLNLILSMLAALQAPVIMMSQNRQDSKDRVRADLDYQVNLKSEIEIMELHRKVDRMKDEMVDLLVAVRDGRK